MAAVKLAATEQGSGPPLLILHGLFGSSRNWSTPAQRLGAERHVFALDARNHGASPWADSMTYPDMTADVQAFAAARGLGPAAVIGHSMGGKTAMLLALNHAEAVERLVIVDVAPVPYPPALAAYVRAMRRVNLAGVSRRAEVDAQLAGAITSQAERGFLLLHLRAAGRWQLRLVGVEQVQVFHVFSLIRCLKRGEPARAPARGSRPPCCGLPWRGAAPPQRARLHRQSAATSHLRIRRVSASRTSSRMIDPGP